MALWRASHAISLESQAGFCTVHISDRQSGNVASLAARCYQRNGRCDYSSAIWIHERFSKTFLGIYFRTALLVLYDYHDANHPGNVSIPLSSANGHRHYSLCSRFFRNQHILDKNKTKFSFRGSRDDRCGLLDIQPISLLPAADPSTVSTAQCMACMGFALPALQARPISCLSRTITGILKSKDSRNFFLPLATIRCISSILFTSIQFNSIRRLIL
jgi:hypothetical protein